ncbi:MAG: hypothetical protein OXL96_08865 [Candidatus Poribacteria bacterium]|nr:hypothetical protein [Candidatus Poribacteria bacterium]
MLSNKMTVSLMSLITILALAFMVQSVIAGEFEGSVVGVEDADDTSTALSMDVSHDDGLQVERADVLESDTTSTPNTAFINVRLKFDRAVVPAGVTVAGYDKDGDYLPGVKVGTLPTDAGQNQVIPIILGTGDDATAATAAANMVTKVTLKIGKGLASHEPFNDDTSKEIKTDIYLLNLDPDVAADGTGTNRGPDVYKIALVGEPFAVITTATFQAHILLSEEPKGGFNKDLIDAGESTVDTVVKLASPADHTRVGPDNPGFTPDGIVIVMRAGETAFADTALDEETTNVNAIDVATWRDNTLHLYLVTFNTKPGEKTVNIKVKNFLSKETPSGAQLQATYVRMADDALTPGRDILTVKTKQDDPKEAKVAGVKWALPKEKYIPGGGYLVVAEDKAGSAVHVPPGEIKEAPKPHERTPSEMMYNVIDDGDLPNLETFLANGGTIGIMGPHALMITEIMWGSDASLIDPGKSQWLELYNPGAGYQTQDGDNTTYLVFYGAGDVSAAGLHDLVGTVDATAGYWPIAGKGQSGASGGLLERTVGAGGVEVVSTVQEPVISPIISMSRMMTGTTLAKGTLGSSWVQSQSPSSNFESNAPGVHIGSPGAKPVTFPEPPAPAPTPVTVPVADAMDIKITEIMVDTGDGRLPQWIELTNVSGAEKSLAGWSLMITNSDADEDVIGATVNINLSGTLGVGGGTDAGGTMGKSLLLVGGTARSSSNLAGSDRVVDISSQVDQRGRYAFISSLGFMAALIPPQKTGILAYGDTAGNLEGGWDLPMDESGRSSLIRREELDDKMATMGTDANGWILASSTPLVRGPATWYGSDEDAGTPGYDSGGPLPVELSHFRPARDKTTGAVVITWATQSELNNAGFFIKRSNQRNGEFKVINATMVAGAGTTSEKQFYTYTDTTAQPNVVYYYQIEDVSLDGNRQTLTNGIRLKGHIGAAGKLTTTWGDLKTSHE